MNPMRPEDQIVILSARPELSRAHKQHLQMLVSHNQLDWGYLVKVSRRHGLDSLLYHHLSGCEWNHDEIPAGILERLRQHYYATACQNTLRLQEAGRVLNALRKEEIPVIALKGLALAEPLYQNIALRPMIDIDVMIRPADYRRLTALLEQLGYICHKSAVQRLAWERFGCNLEFSRASGGCVDLHWDLSTYERLKGVVALDADDFWQWSGVQTIAGCPVGVLCPEHLLLYQAFDAGFIHGFDRLLGGCDVLAVLEAFATALDWDMTLASARAAGLKSVLYAVLFWARRLWAAPVPEEVLRALRPASRFRRHLIERCAGWRVDQDSSSRRHFSLQFLLLDGTAAMARMCGRVLVPSDDWLVYFYALRSPRLAVPLRVLHPFLLPFNRQLR